MYTFIIYNSVDRVQFNLIIYYDIQNKALRLYFKTKQ